MDPTIVIAGLIVGVLVGLTGMGGGALMTPVLVLVFGVQPLAAVSSDLVVSLFMKPVGGLVHLRRGTVHFELVKWLCVGSVPAAFGGVLLLRALGNGESVQDIVKVALGVALLLAVITMCARGLLDLRRHGRAWRSGTVGTGHAGSGPVAVKILPTIVIGIVGGVVVGMTSVGSGSLIIVLLLVLYPRLRAGSWSAPTWSRRSRWSARRHSVTRSSATCSSRSPSVCWSARSRGCGSAPGCRAAPRRWWSAAHSRWC